MGAAEADTGGVVQVPGQLTINVVKPARGNCTYTSSCWRERCQQTLPRTASARPPAWLSV